MLVVGESNQSVLQIALHKALPPSVAMRITRNLLDVSNGVELRPRKLQDLPYPLGWLAGLAVAGLSMGVYVDRRAATGIQQPQEGQHLLQEGQHLLQQQLTSGLQQLTSGQHMLQQVLPFLRLLDACSCPPVHINPQRQARHGETCEPPRGYGRSWSLRGRSSTPFATSNR